MDHAVPLAVAPTAMNKSRARLSLGLSDRSALICRKCPAGELLASSFRAASTGGGNLPEVCKRGGLIYHGPQR